MSEQNESSSPVERLNTEDGSAPDPAGGARVVKVEALIESLKSEALTATIAEVVEFRKPEPLPKVELRLRGSKKRVQNGLHNQLSQLWQAGRGNKVGSRTLEDIFELLGMMTDDITPRPDQGVDLKLSVDLPAGKVSFSAEPYDVELHDSHSSLEEQEALEEAQLAATKPAGA